MISLRSLGLTAVAALASLTLASCKDGPASPLSKGIQPSSASFSGTSGTTSANNGDIDGRVMLDKAGNAILVVRTGTYDPATNAAAPNGYFLSIQYKIYNSTGSLLRTKTINFRSAGSTMYWTYLNPCDTDGTDYDDENDNHSADAASRCSSKYQLSWSVTIQANIKGVSGDTKTTDVVRESGTDSYLPDIDILNQKLYVVGAGGAQTLASSVPAAAPVTYSVPLPNNKPINGIANPLGASVTCLVYVDNAIQLAIPNVQIPFTNIWTNPNLFAYTNGLTQAIPAGATGACQFSLSLPAGAHTIAVSALVSTPGDYDISNNTTAKFTVTASSGPPDVAVYGNLQKLVGTTYSPLGSLTITSGTTITTTVYQQIVQSSLTTPSSVACKFTVDGSDVASQPTVTPALNGVASSGYCGVPVTLGEGTHKVKVTALSTPADGNAVNDTITTFVTVANGAVTGNLASGLFLANSGKVSIVPGPADVTSATTNKYSADVTLTGLTGTTASIPVTCSALVDNVALVPGSPTTVTVGTSTAVAVLTWDATNGQNLLLANNATGSCQFSLKLTENQNKDVVHTIKVTATSNATVPATTTTATGTVRDLVRVDLAAGSMQLVSGGALVPLVSTGMGVKDTLAAVFHNPDATHSVDFTCQVLVSGNAVTDSSYVPIKLTATAAPNGDADCRWAYRPLFLQALNFTVTATPTASAPVDPSLANNTVAGTLGVKSTGKFTSFDPTATYVTQEWFNVAATGFPVEKMTTQIVQVTQLALLVVPTTGSTLGTFTLRAQTTNGTTTFPAGTVSGQLATSSSGVQCSVITGPNDKFPNAPADLPSQYGYFASVCAQPTTFNGASGFQQITVNFAQSIETLERTNPIVNPGKWAFTPGPVDVAIQLDFSLPGAQPDMVKGTIRIPTGNAVTLGTGDDKFPGALLWTFRGAGAPSILP